MNSSIYSADRTTHLRIVAVALAGSIAIMGFFISVRLGSMVSRPEIVETSNFRGPDLAGKEALTGRPSTHRI